VLELARLVDDEALAEKLEAAYGRGVKLLALEIAERETILVALDDPPPGLEELRGVLLSEREWRYARDSSNYPLSSGCSSRKGRTPAPCVRSAVC